jgi:hypothetical protein
MLCCVGLIYIIVIRRMLRLHNDLFLHNNRRHRSKAVQIFQTFQDQCQFLCNDRKSADCDLEIFRGNTKRNALNS